MTPNEMTYESILQDLADRITTAERDLAAYREIRDAVVANPSLVRVINKFVRPW